MKPLVSVIVPVYNTEKYLPRCLNSLRKQSLQNIEIILIDNASTDRSGDICDAYVNSDVRFKIFHQSVNSGPSAARNLGIKMSKGDYLMFVDSDDWVHEDFCKKPYECTFHNKVDLVMFGYQWFNNIGFRKKSIITSLPSGFKSRFDAIEILLKYAGDFPCNKLYRKNLFNKVQFPVGYMYEDIATIYKVVWNAANVYCIDDVLYFYCFRPGSITTLKTKKALADWFKMSMYKYQDLIARGYPISKLNLYLMNISFTYCIKKKRDFSDQRYVFCVKTLDLCKKMPNDFTWKRKTMYILFKFYPLLFEWICRLFGKKYSD